MLPQTFWKSKVTRAIMTTWSRGGVAANRAPNFWRNLSGCHLFAKRLNAFFFTASATLPLLPPSSPMLLLVLTPSVSSRLLGGQGTLASVSGSFESTNALHASSYARAFGAHGTDCGAGVGGGCCGGGCGLRVLLVLLRRRLLLPPPMLLAFR